MYNYSMSNRMTKDTIPEGFTVPLVIVDMIPVVFFCLSAFRVGRLICSKIFVAGAIICLLSGLIKVLWKFIAAVKRKNIWPLFLQMRIAMPVGFLLLAVALLIDRSHYSLALVLSVLTGFPSVIFFSLGAIGMILMSVFAFKLDSSDPKSNWIEQITNSLAQICFFVGLLLV